jgi:hypothetical protein
MFYREKIQIGYVWLWKARRKTILGVLQWKLTDLSNESVDIYVEKFEHFVDAQAAAEFLSLKPRRILELARAGQLPGYPIGFGTRRIWRFRLSELSSAITAKNSTFTSAAAPGINAPRQPLRRK